MAAPRYRSKIPTSQLPPLPAPRQQTRDTITGLLAAGIVIVVLCLAAALTIAYLPPSAFEPRNTVENSK